jgi:hypothetical protein
VFENGRFGECDEKIEEKWREMKLSLIFFV